jgi:hypothetical protein
MKADFVLSTSNHLTLEISPESVSEQIALQQWSTLFYEKQKGGASLLITNLDGRTEYRETPKIKELS